MHAATIYDTQYLTSAILFYYLLHFILLYRIVEVLGPLASFVQLWLFILLNTQCFVWLIRRGL